MGQVSRIWENRIPRTLDYRSEDIPLKARDEAGYLQNPLVTFRPRFVQHNDWVLSAFKTTTRRKRGTKIGPAGKRSSEGHSYFFFLYLLILTLTSLYHLRVFPPQVFVQFNSQPKFSRCSPSMRPFPYSKTKDCLTWSRNTQQPTFGTTGINQ